MVTVSPVLATRSATAPVSTVTGLPLPMPNSSIEVSLHAVARAANPKQIDGKMRNFIIVINLLIYQLLIYPNPSIQLPILLGEHHEPRKYLHRHVDGTGHVCR